MPNRKRQSASPPASDLVRGGIIAQLQLFVQAGDYARTQDQDSKLGLWAKMFSESLESYADLSRQLQAGGDLSCSEAIGLKKMLIQARAALAEWADVSVEELASQL